MHYTHINIKMLRDYFQILKNNFFGGMGGISLYCWIKKLKDVLYRIFSIQVIKKPHIIRINRALNVMQSTQLLTNLQPCY